jgi:hypothetical protein
MSVRPSFARAAASSSGVGSVDDMLVAMMMDTDQEIRSKIAGQRGVEWKIKAPHKHKIKKFLKIHTSTTNELEQTIRKQHKGNRQYN